MPAPSPPANSPVLAAALQRIFTGLEPPVEDVHEVLRFMNEELPPLDEAGHSYLVLGSYRDEYGIRLRQFAHELGKPTTIETVVLGDTRPLDVAVLDEFDIKLNLLGQGVDTIAGVYEKEDGCEAPELGVVHTAFFLKTHVFPRDFVPLQRGAIDCREAAISAAIDIYYTDDESIDRYEALLSLLTIAQENGVALSERELVDVLKTRDAEVAETPAAYSWVHRSCFSKFASAGQCHPWTTVSELYAAIDELPGRPRSEWEDRFDMAVLDGLVDPP